jgi:glycosyltransferase involved in cell wall biosynthesis
MRIVLVTEAWQPQVNGVVTTWTHVKRELEAQGHEMFVIHPEMFRTMPCPRYPSIPIVIRPGRSVAQLLDGFDADAIHIATEGPLGSAARRYCLRRRLPFTSSYHSQFPEYFRKYFGMPLAMSYAYMRRFHRAAERVLVPTPSMKSLLDSRGFTKVVVWSRGVDSDLFKPSSEPSPYGDMPRPIFLCAGRVALEKNIGAFLAADLPGTKVVMGDGPARPALESQFPAATFLGYQDRPAFVRYMAGADVFVFPSRTDTFGLVMLEAMACGVPVAAYPVTGPIDVVHPGVTGALNEDIAVAAKEALTISRAACRQHAERMTWRACADQVLANLAMIRQPSAMLSAI